MALEKHATVPSIKWIGLSIQDLQKHNIPAHVRLPVSILRFHLTFLLDNLLQLSWFSVDWDWFIQASRPECFKEPSLLQWAEVRWWGTHRVEFFLLCVPFFVVLCVPHFRYDRAPVVQGPSWGWWSPKDGKLKLNLSRQLVRTIFTLTSEPKLVGPATGRIRTYCIRSHRNSVEQPVQPLPIYVIGVKERGDLLHHHKSIDQEGLFRRVFSIQ